MKFLAPLLMAAAVAAPAIPAFAAPDLAKGKESFAAVCAACHGENGNSTIGTFPSLAGQHPQYIVKQLEEFKSGKRVDPTGAMEGMAALLETPQDMANVAAWLASQKPALGVATEQELVALGERIFRGGVPDRKIAACAGCHSPNGAGIPAQYPRLSGQLVEYTIAQLNAFRDGSRANSQQMTDVAAKLNDREIKAVADYIAGLR